MATKFIRHGHDDNTCVWGSIKSLQKMTEKYFALHISKQVISNTFSDFPVIKVPYKTILANKLTSVPDSFWHSSTTEISCFQINALNRHIRALKTVCEQYIKGERQSGPSCFLRSSHIYTKNNLFGATYNGYSFYISSNWNFFLIFFFYLENSVYCLPVQKWPQQNLSIVVGC